MLVVPFQMALDTALGIDLYRDENGFKLLAWIAVTVSLPTWLYFIIFEASRLQATPAKLLLHLRVTDDDGGRLRRLRVVLRTFVKLFPLDTLYVTLLIPTPLIHEQARGEFRFGGIFVLGMVALTLLMTTWNACKQSMHDLIAESCVLDVGHPMRR